MTSALNPIRALFVAVVCFAALAAWAPFASAQEVPAPGDTDVVPDPPPPPPVDPPPVDPPVDPVAPPPADPAPVDPPPDPAPVDQAPADPAPVEPAGDRNPPARDDGSRSDARTPTFAAPQNPAATTVPSDAFTTPAQLPPAGPGEDFALTGDGDAFILGSGGSSGSGPTALLGSFSRFGSIATAAARVPALGAREQAARDAARANASSSGDRDGGRLRHHGPVLEDVRRGRRRWRSDDDAHRARHPGGGAACFRPRRLKNFLISTAVWRPSAYVPPIEHPG